MCDRKERYEPTAAASPVVNTRRNARTAFLERTPVLRVTAQAYARRTVLPDPESDCGIQGPIAADSARLTAGRRIR